jgi:hypothetical protein
MPLSFLRLAYSFYEIVARVNFIPGRETIVPYTGKICIVWSCKPSFCLAAVYLNEQTHGKVTYKEKKHNGAVVLRKQQA